MRSKDRRGAEEGCLATELQVIMGQCEARGEPHNAKQSVTGRLCQYYITYTKSYDVYYKCPPRAILLETVVIILNFSQVFDAMRGVMIGVRGKCNEG